VILVISGGNGDSPLLERVIRRELFRKWLVLVFSACLEDLPGTAAALLAIIGQLKAKVFHLYNHSSGHNMPVHLSCVEAELETRGPTHVEEILGELQRAGYKIQCSSSQALPHLP